MFWVVTRRRSPLLPPPPAHSRFIKPWNHFARFVYCTCPTPFLRKNREVRGRLPAN